VLAINLQSTFKTLFAKRRLGKALYASLRIRQTKSQTTKWRNRHTHTHSTNTKDTKVSLYLESVPRVACPTSERQFIIINSLQTANKRIK